VIHCAASLNRKSEKSCLNVNLRGTLEVVQLARRTQYYHGLRRFSNVSTVAVAGKRSHEVVSEDGSIEWERSDYDPYARTKKFCEHMVRELLPDVPLTIFRPSIVLGDSRYPQTTQFDMVRAFVFLAGLPVLPFRPHDKIDIVNVDFVANAISTLHMRANPEYDIYHLSSGNDSQTFQELTQALAAEQNRRGPLFLPILEKPFRSVVHALANRQGPMGHGAALMKVFLPYLTWNTVFDNTRVTSEVGGKPAPFSEYSFPLFRFSREHNFEYPYQPWPEARKREGRPHDGLRFRSVGFGHHREQENSVDDGQAGTVAAGRETEAAVCGLQRDAQYGIGCARGRDAAADSADSRAGES
jgi:nucleoside-diphosphate-sugar epimerase